MTIFNITAMFKYTKASSTFSVADLEKAKEFYGKTLGLEISESTGELVLRLADGNEIFVYPKPNHIPAAFTIINFRVNDVEEAVDELTKLGVRFEVYNQGELKTDGKGIFQGDGLKIAWFKDPARNFLSVLQE
jgi:catechol 2,3-dioxygenase-like lactoylglutathione lyase family enzyme